MFVNNNRTKITSSHFLDNKSFLWIYDIQNEQEKFVAFGGSNIIQLWKGKGDYFAAQHKSIYSIRDLNSPETSICDIVFHKETFTFKGDISSLCYVPRFFTRKSSGWKRKSIYELVEINPESKNIILTPLLWFSADNYNTLYQSVIGAYELPNDDIIVTLQRSNHMVLLDGNSKKPKKEIYLPGPTGNTQCFVCEKRGELWANNYDVLNKFDLETFEVIQTEQVHPLITREIAKRNDMLEHFVPGKTHGFIGNFQIDEEREFCVVPRPYMGDVQILDLDKMDVKYQAQTGGNPIQAVFINNKTVYAKCWKTNDLFVTKVKAVRKIKG